MGAGEIREDEGRVALKTVDSVLERVLAGEVRSLGDRGDGGGRGDGELDFDFDELLDFYREAGFLYERKLRELEPLLPVIRATWEGLARADGRICKLVARRRAVGRRSRIQSTVSAFLWAPGTWLAQHLVSAKRGAYTDTLVALLGLVAWLEENPEVSHVRLTYRPDNPGVKDLFERWASSFDARAWALSEHDHAICDLALGGVLPFPSGRNVAVRQAGGADTDAVRGILGSWVPTVELDSLALAEMDLGGVAAAYAASGLVRGRTVLIASHGGRAVGVVFLHVASEGMNFSFLENAVEYLAVRDSLDGELAREVVVALLRGAFAHAREAGRDRLILHLDPRWRALLEELGLCPGSWRRYGVLTFSREHGSFRRLRRSSIAYYRQRFLGSGPERGGDVVHHAGA